MRYSDQIASSDVSGGQDGGGIPNGGNYLLGRQPILPQFLGIDSHDNRSLIATKRRRRRYPRERREDGSYAVKGDILHLCHTARRTRKNKLGHRDATCVEPCDKRWDCSRRHEGPGTTYVPDDLRHRLAHIHVRVKDELHKSDA